MLQFPIHWGPEVNPPYEWRDLDLWMWSPTHWLSCGCFVSIPAAANHKRNSSGLCHLMWWGAAILDSFRKDANCALIHASHHTYLSHMSLKHVCLIYTVERWTAAPNFTLYSPLAATGGTGAHTSTTDASVFRRLQRNCLNSLNPCLHCWMCWSFYWILVAATFGQHHKHILYGIKRDAKWIMEYLVSFCFAKILEII